MAFTRVWDDTYPGNGLAANQIGTYVEQAKVDLRERLMSIFTIPDFTSDPLKVQAVGLGYAGIGTGGYVKIVDDTGVYRWFAGIGSGSGGKDYNIYDTVNSASRFAINATSGAISIVSLTATGAIAANSLSSTTSLSASTGSFTGNVTIGGTLGVTGAITGNLTGNVTGNVTGNCSGSSGSCTGNAATATNVAASGITGTIADAQIGGLTATKLSGPLPAISGANLTAITGANVTGTVASATTAGSCSGNAATATNASQLGGYAQSAFAMLSGASFSGNISVPHANSMSAGAFYVI